MPFAVHLSQDAASDLVPPPNSAQPERQQLKPGDVCVGCIVWLPPMSSCNMGVKCTRTNANCGQMELAEAGYNHPVMVLKIRQRKNSAVSGDLVCTIALVTSFSGMSLPVYTKKRSYLDTSMPIHQPDEEDQALTAPRTHTKLKLEKGKLWKQSYIKLEHVYDIPVHHLRTYAHQKFRAYKLRLSEPSYKLVMDKLNMPHEKYEVTDTLFETANARLLALMNSESRLLFPPVPRHHHPVEPLVVRQQPRGHPSYNTRANSASHGYSSSTAPLLPTHSSVGPPPGDADEDYGWLPYLFTATFCGIGCLVLWCSLS